MSEFGALNIALTGIQAQRRALEITGHNVTNANTDGYSRQTIDLQAIGGATIPGIFARASGQGQGVTVAGFTRYADQFLQIRAALEHGSQAELTQVQGTLTALENLFAEPSDQSIGKGLSDFWSSWGDLANHPDDPASRAQLLERANTLSSTFNSISGQLTQMRLDSIAQLSSTVSDINTMAGNLARLNSAIQTAETAGTDANDLKDQRDLLADQLATKVGGTVRAGQYDSVNVFVNGTALVNQGNSEPMSLDMSGPSAVVRWTHDNYPATITSGDAGGLLDVINARIPTYQGNLDVIANQLRDDVNGVAGAMGGSLATTAQNQSASGNLQFQVSLGGGAFATATVAGADWSGVGGAAALQTALQNAVDTAIGAGSATVTVTGGNGSPLAVSLVPTGSNTIQVQAVSGNAGFSTLLGSTAVGLDGVGGRQFFSGNGAAGLTVASDVAGNPSAIAAGASGAGPLDGSVALNLADVGTTTTGADAKYRSFIVNLGVDSQDATQRLNIQNSTVQQVDGARQSYSGVNTDEEMVSMVEYQHAYEASARFLTTVDTVLDTLINRTGMP